MSIVQFYWFGARTSVFFFFSEKKNLDRLPSGCYNNIRYGAPAPVIYGPLAQLVRASGS